MDAMPTSLDWYRYLLEHEDLTLYPFYRKGDPLVTRDGTVFHPVADEFGLFTIRVTDTHTVQVVPMLFNYRVTVAHTSSPLSLTGGWCYFGVDALSFTRAVHAAWEWDPQVQSSPRWYDKDVFTGEYSPLKDKVKACSPPTRRG